MTNTGLTPEEILNLIPQQSPFRFIDQITEVDAEQITGSYTFRADEFFYRGHFPGKPVTPGVILLECMCQIGVVALGIYLLSLEVTPAEIKQWLTMFTDAEFECMRSVAPNDTVIVKAKKLFWRRKKLRAEIKMYTPSGELIAAATASGIGVTQ
jgi:3-hydroxyacyl-[acyl-carrier-protein] dehydratase